MRGIEVSQETVRSWRNKFGPMFAAEIMGRRVEAMRPCHHWRWQVDEGCVKIIGVTQYLWRAVNHEGEVPESIVSKMQDRKANLKFLKNSMKPHGRPETIVTDQLRSHGADQSDLGRGDDREVRRWLNNGSENSHQLLCRLEREMLRKRSMRTFQKFTPVHAYIHKHLLAERHIQNRATYILTTAAALAEWRGPLDA